MAPIDIIILTIIIVALVASFVYAYKRGGECGDCPSHGTCTASIDGHCPVSEIAISRIERGLHDMTGVLGGESCGIMTPKPDNDEKRNGKASGDRHDESTEMRISQLSDKQERGDFASFAIFVCF